MKKVLSLVLILFYAGFIGAVGMNNEVNGPVKKMTIFISVGDGTDGGLTYGNKQVGPMAKIVCWYDSIGRLLDEANYHGEDVTGYVRQYLMNNVYMEYEYNNQGIVKGSFARGQLDSLGNTISTKRYRDRELISADSTVYDKQGHKVKYYDTPYKSDTLVIKNTYEYDSLGRLSKYYDYSKGEISISREVVYYPNGSYTERTTDRNGKVWEKIYIADKKGNIVKIEEPNRSAQYSKFDRYGNWLILRGVTHKVAKTTTERIIEYYE